MDPTPHSSVPQGVAILATSLSSTALEDTPFNNLSPEHLAKLPYCIGVGTTKVRYLEWPWGGRVEGRVHLSHEFSVLIPKDVRQCFVTLSVT